MKKIKKLLALIVAMTMVLGMAMTVSAAVPSERDEGKITVQNVEEENADVKAYRIVEPVYNEYGLTGYAEVIEGTIDDHTNYVPTAGEIIALAGMTDRLGPAITLDPVYVEEPEGSGTLVFTNSFSKTVAAGEYLIIINGTDIYNPMVVSVKYSANNSDDIENGTVDADSNWTLENGTVFVKSTPVDIEKTVSEPDVKVGDTVEYKITGTIPSYSKTYDNPVYKITDTLKNATFATETVEEVTTTVEPVVTIGGKTASKGTDYKFTWTDANDDGTYDGFVIDFLNLASYAGKGVAERAVVITYNAVISESAASSNPATNRVDLDYGNSTDVKKDFDITYTYTFEINDRFKKVDEKEAPQAGATFTLFAADKKTVVATTQSTIGADGNAYIDFTGLDAGTYYLQETMAPGGYSVNETMYKVVIAAEYNDDGTLKNSSVSIGEVGEDGEATVDSDEVIIIQNTKLASLPSTGGIGTTIFTIGGCVIMIAAAALFFVNRRKSEEN